MPLNAIAVDEDVAIWDRTIQFEKEPSRTAARALLDLQFSANDVTRMGDLAAKARAGILSAAEQIEIDTYERLGACSISSIPKPGAH